MGEHGGAVAVPGGPETVSAGWRSVMDDGAGKTYRAFEPEQYAQQAYSPAQKLPEGDLVYFLLDLTPQLDLSRFRRHYEDETRGAPPFDPTQMVCLLVYAYSVGVFSSRKIALACEPNRHPPPPHVIMPLSARGRHPPPRCLSSTDKRDFSSRPTSTPSSTCSR